jgi:hypothetical protein
MTTPTVPAELTNNPNPTEVTMLPGKRMKVSIYLSRLSAPRLSSGRLQELRFVFLTCVAFGVTLILCREACSQTPFTIQNRQVGDFAGFAATSGVQVITGDFDGDGGTDIGLVRRTAGWTSVPVALTSIGNVAHQLQVRRFTTATLSNVQAATILASARTVLQMNDGPGDVACSVTMSRGGAVTVFADGDGSIDSEAEFDTLYNLPGHVKVVNQINRCDGLIPNVLGCAQTPGNSLVVVRTMANREGSLWAHEFGHNQGLRHRNDANALMHETLFSTNKRINAGECDAFKTLAPLSLVASVVMPQDNEAGHKSEPNLKNVKRFVRQVFVHGVPYDQASEYDSSAVPTLLEMLNDSAEEAYWPNIVVVMGIIGDESAVDPLISFIEEDIEDDIEGRLSREHYAAKTSALMALGYLINKTGNQQALDYLKESVDPQVWAARDITGTAPFQVSTTERNRDLSKYSILGLAVSGHPEAAEALRWRNHQPWRLALLSLHPELLRRARALVRTWHRRHLPGGICCQRRCTAMR